MQRITTGLFLLVLALVAAFFLLGPMLTERSMNTVAVGELPEVRDEARALHASLTIVDLHSDTLIWDRSLMARSQRGHMDVPRLIDGNVALQVFSSVTKSPRGQNYDNNSADAMDNMTLLAVAQVQPFETWSSLVERSLFHARKLNGNVSGSQGVLRKIETPGDLGSLLGTRNAARRDEMLQPVGAMLSIEGLHNLEGDGANLDRLYDAGYRMASPTHFFDNELAGSMHGESKQGLTDFGREIIRAMENKGMIVDIAHCSPQCVSDILAMARRPVVSSHGGVQATCEVNRNLTDEQIRAVAANGGVIGVGYWPGAICDTKPSAIAAAMKHIRDLVGAEHVALGSDYDGATEVAFDTSRLVHVTQALMDAGFSEAEIRALMGGNALRVIRNGIRPL
ncbi:dipeptidase [Altererythrobacter sp. MF3-039]|uniref:dipeptidase n=1 Tax=Altererythrobacter sp. MF3-039 TaxID=3252901 RepID=UPI00390CD264